MARGGEREYTVNGRVILNFKLANINLSFARSFNPFTNHKMNDRRDFIKKMSALGLIGSATHQRIPGAQPAANPELTWHASGNGGIVAGGPKVSAIAGINILEKGGNAVDSAVAMIFNLAISDYGLFSIGGESPFMCYNAGDGKVNVFNGMGSAPKDPRAI